MGILNQKNLWPTSIYQFEHSRTPYRPPRPIAMHCLPIQKKTKIDPVLLSYLSNFLTFRHPCHLYMIQIRKKVIHLCPTLITTYVNILVSCQPHKQFEIS